MAKAPARTASPSPSPSVKSIIALSPKPSEEATASPSPTSWKNASKVTHDSIFNALQDLPNAAFSIPINNKTVRDINVNEDADGYSIKIEVNPGDFYDEKDFVKKSGGSLLVYSKVLLENPSVYSITVLSKINTVSDQEKFALQLSWTKKEAANENIDELLDQMFGDITIPFRVARNYSIDSDIYNELDSNDFPIEDSKYNL